MTAALLLCDLQNDFLHPDGAYGRAGLGNAEIAALPARLAPLAQKLRAAGRPSSLPCLRWCRARPARR